MIHTKDKSGRDIWITYWQDCGENENGFYCETYADENLDVVIDYFCVHPGDFQPYFGEDFYDRLEEYIAHHYDDEVLDFEAHRYATKD